MTAPHAHPAKKTRPQLAAGPSLGADSDPTGLLAGAPVQTLEGELPLEFLTPGDRVVTRSGARVLRQITVARVENAAVVQIRAGSLGQGRPKAALTIGAGQLVLLRDWRAKAMFDSPQALVPVARLIDGAHLRREIRTEARLITLQFDRLETIYVGGLELSCPAFAEAPVA